MERKGDEEPQIHPGILSRWSQAQFDEEISEDDSDSMSLPWEDLGLGAAFGGRYIDDDTMVVCATKPLSSAQVPARVKLRTVDRSWQDLLHIKESLLRVLVDGAPENGFVGVGPNPVSNTVRIHVATPEAADAPASQAPFRELIALGSVEVEVLGPVFLS